MKRDVVFVFGSNLAGRHGKGAALEAVRNWGAQYGVGEGRTGNAYALPTKDESLKTLPLASIRQSFIRFWKYALRNPDTQFLLTPVGTGLAGHTFDDIKRVTDFGVNPLRNIWWTGDWWPALAMSAGTAETVQPAQGDSPPARAEGNAQNKDRDHG